MKATLYVLETLPSRFPEEIEQPLSSRVDELVKFLVEHKDATRIEFVGLTEGCFDSLEVTACYDITSWRQALPITLAHPGIDTSDNTCYTQVANV